MTSRLAVAFYAGGTSRLGAARTLLHLPYTGWHLAYVVFGAALAEHLSLPRLALTVAAFFLAVGVTAHALDEIHGHPLLTGYSDRSLWLIAGAGFTLTALIALAGVLELGFAIAFWAAIGVALLVGYNLELWGGVLHTDRIFALSWGAYPVLVSAFVQDGQLSVAAVVGAAAAYFLAQAQRVLSTWARHLRRNVRDVRGVMTLSDDRHEPVDIELLLAPVETALRTLSWSVMTIAAAVILMRATW